MEQQFYTILTNVGKAKIANSNVLNTKLNLTKFQVGDGGGAYYNPTEDQTKLKNKVWEGNINSIRVDKDNPSWIVIEVVIPSNEGGFMIREAGILDDEGNLIAVGKYPETFKPHIDNGSSKDLFIRMILEVSNTQNVTLKVDPTIIMATKKDIEVLESKLQSIENTVLELKNNPIVRGVTPSGFIKFNDIDFVYCSSNQNKIKLTNEGVALVNGWKVTIPDGTIIQLSQPPISGEREDLIFLECWLDQTTKEVKSRIRVVDGVDFINFPRDGISVSSGYGWLSPNYPKATPQGGNANPLSFDNSTGTMSLTTSFNTVNVMNTNGSSLPLDNGLYISGRGTQQSKDILKTFDGFVYAIPMFRVWRRNSSSFSDVNPNGGNFLKVIVPTSNFNPPNYLTIGNMGDIVLSTNDYNQAIVGESYCLPLNNSFYCFRVIDKKANNTITIMNIGGPNPFGTMTYNWRLYTRPDYLLSDIIDKTDIIDLRHKTSLRGYDYQQMLLENFDRAGRGELQTNIYNDMLKTYHGIRKTPIDANTLFYCSFDNTVIPEVGASYMEPININTPAFLGYRNCPTGLGLGLNPIGSSVGAFAFPTIPITKDSTFTVDVGVFLTDNTPSMDTWVIFSVGFGSYYSYTGNNGISFKSLNVGYNHLRLVYKPGSTKTYLNGKLVADSPFREEFDHHGMSIPDMFRLHVLCNSNNDYRLKSPWVLFDLSISNVDRGDVFPTLSKDFIDGYAKIAPAFSEQRKCFSDALTSEYKSHVLKSAAPKTYPRGITVTQASSNWAANDKIVIKGLAGEIIMGVVDTDTALCKVVSYTDGQVDYRITKGDTKQLIVNNITGIAVGDKLNFYSGPTDSTGVVTITAIDTTNNIITLDQTFVSGQVNIHYLFETTSSSSSPITKFKKADGTIIQANMVWSGLGTNEATGTIQTTTELTNQDLQIEYSLVEVEGQGPFSDLPYQVLSAEVNGQKYVVNGPQIIDDFKGKVRGSIVENPNIAKYSGSSSLLSPSSFTNEVGNEAADIYQYPSMSNIDNVFNTVGEVLNGRASILFSFNLIEIVERKLGTKIPSIDKVAWLKNNLKNFKIVWRGYGKGPGGNKATMQVWGMEGRWVGDGLVTTSNVPTSMTYDFCSALEISWIGSDGFVHAITYAEVGDSTTGSAIYTDYINIEINLKKPSDEYDLLTPINPRRDGGISNILAIRKETNEIRNLYGPTLDNNSKVATYSSYVPYQGTSILPKQGVYPLTDWVVIASTMGTGDYNLTAVSRAKFYKGIYGLPLCQKSDLYKFKCELMDVNGDKVPITKINYHNTSLGQYAMALNYPIGGNLLNDKYYRGYKLDNFIGVGDADNGVYGIAADVSIKGNYYLVAARLVVDNQGNILMLLSRSNGNILYNDGAQGSADTFYLKDRPIIGGF